MKKNRIITILIAALTVLAASCTKEMAVSQDRIPVKLKASIGVPTKTSYEVLDGIIKTDWCAYDTVSVITVQHTASGDLITAVDNLVNTAGDGPAAVFEGTLTAVDGEISRYVMYPCMSYEDGPYSEYHYNHTYVKSNSDLRTLDHTVSCNLGNDFIKMNSMTSDLEPDDLSSLQHYDFMTGVLCEEADGTYSSVLKKQSAMHVLEVTFPDGYVNAFLESLEGDLADIDVFAFEIKLPGNRFSDGMFYQEHSRFNENGDLEFDIVTPYPEAEHFMFFPNESIQFYLRSIKGLPSSFTLYKPVLGGAEIKAGTTISVTLHDSFTGGFLFEKELTVKNDYLIEPGHIYTYRADFR